MPIVALPAMRAAIAYSSPAAINTWADYANTVFDSLLAVEFRNASSLAGATLYGSTPTVDSEPVGGLNFSASGLVCAGDTLLDTGITVDSTSTWAVFAVINNGETTFRVAPFGSSATPSAFILTADSGTSVVRVRWLNVAYDSPPPLSDATLGVIGNKYYVDGSTVTTMAISGTAGSVMKIGSRGDATNKFWGNIEAFVIGTLKAGADADTVASELHTRMQTAAL